MESGEKITEIDSLEKGLLPRGCSSGETENSDEILFSASFIEMEENFVKYQTARWVLYSLLLVLAWGAGLLMLLYLPIRRYILRRDIRSRKLYLTSNAIIYEVTRPVSVPCFGVYKREKHVLLHSVADLVIEQGYLQSLFGVYSLRVENAGIRRPPSDDVQILGVVNPSDFKKAVLTRLSIIRTEALSKQASALEEFPHLRMNQSSADWVSPSNALKRDSFSMTPDIVLLQRLEEVETSVKRVQNLMEEEQAQTSKHKILGPST